MGKQIARAAFEHKKSQTGAIFLRRLSMEMRMVISWRATAASWIEWNI